MERETKITVSAQVEMQFANGNVSHMTIDNIPCVWLWDETNRENAEYWAVLDYVADHFKYDWVSVKSWTGSPRKGTDR